MYMNLRRKATPLTATNPRDDQGSDGPRTPSTTTMTAGMGMGTQRPLPVPWSAATATGVLPMPAATATTSSTLAMESHFMARGWVLNLKQSSSVSLGNLTYVPT